MYVFFSSISNATKRRRIVFQQSLLSGIEFGKTNWAYLIRGSGGYRIVQKERPLHKISCPLWATLIHEDEIEVTKWVDAAERRGVWNGKPVGKETQGSFVGE